MDVKEPPPDRVELRCTECGYPRRGLKDEDPCPECGAEWGWPVSGSVRRSLPFTIRPRIDEDGGITLCDKGHSTAIPFLGIAATLVGLAIYAELTRQPDEASILVAFLLLSSPFALLGVIHLFVFDRMRIEPSGAVSWLRRRFVISSFATAEVDDLALRRCLVRRVTTFGRAWYGLVLAASDDDIMVLAAERSEAALEGYIEGLPAVLRERITPGRLRFEAFPLPAIIK